MKISCLTAFTIFLVGSPLLARDKVDVLVMNNGDKLTCEIKALDKGVLYIGLDYTQGTVQVDWSKVRSVNSRQLFLVSIQDGRSFTGVLSIEETDVSRVLRIETAENTMAPVLIEQRNVVQINEISQEFWRRFNGSINSGFTFSKANEATQYSLGATAEYLRERWLAGTNYNSTLTSNAGAPTSTRNSDLMYYRHLMRRDNWFYTGIGTLLQSTEQKIQLQGTFGAGIGRYLQNTNHGRINVFSGMAYQNTRYTQTGARPPSQNTVAAMAGANADLFRFDKTNVTVNVITIPALNQPGRVYNNVNAAYYLKFWGNVTWNVSFYGSWDNRPPANFSGSDYGISSGLGWRFGNYSSRNR